MPICNKPATNAKDYRRETVRERDNRRMRQAIFVDCFADMGQAINADLNGEYLVRQDIDVCDIWEILEKKEAAWPVRKYPGRKKIEVRMAREMISLMQASEKHGLKIAETMLDILAEKRSRPIVKQGDC